MKHRPDSGGENSNGILLDDSGTPSGALEKRSDTAMRVVTEKEEESKYIPVAIAPSEIQQQPSVDQRVEYQKIDPKKTKVSWPHDTHMTQRSSHSPNHIVTCSYKLSQHPHKAGLTQFCGIFAKSQIPCPILIAECQVAL